MRHAIACLYGWLTPNLRHPVRTARAARALRAAYQRARAWFALPPLPATVHVIPPMPAYATRPRPRPADQTPHPAEQPLLDSSTLRLIRPYYSAHEQALATARVRQIQRERRTATALATYGVDYDPYLALAVRTAA